MSGRLLNDAKLTAGEDISVRVDNAQILDNATVLDNLDTILKDAEQKTSAVEGESKEYEAIQELKILERQGQREKLLSRIAEHIKEYSQGILAKTIAECLNRQ